MFKSSMGDVLAEIDGVGHVVLNHILNGKPLHPDLDLSNIRYLADVRAAFLRCGYDLDGGQALCESDESDDESSDNTEDLENDSDDTNRWVTSQGYPGTIWHYSGLSSLSRGP